MNYVKHHDNDVTIYILSKIHYWLGKATISLGGKA